MYPAIFTANTHEYLGNKYSIDLKQISKIAFGEDDGSVMEFYTVLLATNELIIRGNILAVWRTPGVMRIRGCWLFPVFCKKQRCRSRIPWGRFAVNHVADGIPGCRISYE